ncbi:tumor protein p53-inducible protein 11 [Caerostris extrusa]|uniref:Tumor protein p53-inducible protein 11 n=1 Tax=Caerostris extrusa TaxID=172846 RepID=A0AAV4NIY5_CAEEX|nr:tumor protein p53-inducible protein 11 [Caerostris extrusa]
MLIENLSIKKKRVTFLTRKHSSGDLQSRLKTRKILGVGETDNGDVHRSKISQVLGHNEHLFVKLPRCFRLWHFMMAVAFTSVGVVYLCTSHAKQDSSSQKEIIPQVEMMANLYGSVLLGFSVMLWYFLGTTDKSIARGLMLSIVIAMLAQLSALLRFAYQNEVWDKRTHTDIFARLSAMLGSGYFFWAIGSSRAGLRKSLSNKDLREKPTPDDPHPSPSSPTTKQSADSKKTE